MFTNKKILPTNVVSMDVEEIKLTLYDKLSIAGRILFKKGRLMSRREESQIKAPDYIIKFFSLLPICTGVAVNHDVEGVITSCGMGLRHQQDVQPIPTRQSS